MQCDVEISQIWSPTPDYAECQTAKWAAPVQGDKDSAKEGVYLVGAVLATAETGIRVFPDTWTFLQIIISLYFIDQN